MSSLKILIFKKFKEKDCPSIGIYDYSLDPPQRNLKFSNSPKFTLPHANQTNLELNYHEAYDRVYKKKGSAPNFLRTTEREPKVKININSDQKNGEVDVNKIQKGFELDKSKYKKELFMKDLKEVEASDILYAI